MVRRIVMIVVLMDAALLASRLIAADDRPPNIIFILADDLGWGDLGCYGQKKIRTPRIDRLAGEGIRFTQFYAGSAVCAPTRCALLTGKHMGHAFVRDNANPKRAQLAPDRNVFPGQIAIPDQEVTLAELLKSRGYATAAIGKWGLGNVGSSGDPNKQGFDLFYGYNCQHHAHNHYPRFFWRNNIQEPLAGNTNGLTGESYAQDRFTDEAIAFVKSNRERPFFLYFAVTIPHLALQVPEASLKEYSGAFAEVPYDGKRGYLPHATPRAAYAAMVTHLDAAVGKLMDELQSSSLDENTLVMFSSDNGPTHDVGGADSPFFDSAANLRGLKGSLYDGGIRVPFVARWPGKIKPASTTDHLSAMWDVLPTLCDVAEVKPPAQVDGISFLPTLLGKAQEQKQHEYLYWEFPGYGGWQAVRRGPWKAVRTEMLKAQNPDPLKIALYNLGKDTAEKHDVSAENPEIVSQMSRSMSEAHRVSSEFPMPPIDK